MMRRAWPPTLLPGHSTARYDVWVGSVSCWVTAASTGLRRRLSYQLSKDVRQDPPMPVVAHLLGRIYPRHRAECFFGPICRASPHRKESARLQILRHSVDLVRLESGEPVSLSRLPIHELERKNSHPDQIRPVYSLERLGDHGADTE